MRKTFIAFVLTATALTGCAGRFVRTAIAPDHPASPALPTPHLPAASNPLAVDEFDRRVLPDETGAPQPDEKASPSSMGHAHHGEGAEKSGAGVSYTCPMHPDVVQQKPVRCPRCGMTLVPEEKR